MTIHPVLFLKQSKIHGVGCFTSSRIRKGEIAIRWDKDDWRKVEARKVKKNRWLYEKHCIWDDEGKYWSCPKSFQRMFVGWYLNHSKQPNIFSKDQGDTWRALRGIKKNEELTIDYDLL